VHMSDASAEKLENIARTDLPYTEVKTEVSIDRVTSAANPRQMERVPAGTVFGRAELVYSIYEGAGCDPAQDIDRLRTLVTGLQLLEDDYLGGQGTRGAGKVQLTGIRVMARNGDYLAPPAQLGEFDDLPKLIAGLDALVDKVQGQILGAA